MLPAFALSLLLGGPAAAPAVPAAVPAEIAEHYRDSNFVNAFSTSSERRLLAESRRVPEDKRLARVARILARLASRIEEIDPGIARESEFPPSRSLGRHESELRAALVRIASCRVDEKKGEAWVHLEVLAVDEGVTGLFVSSYDRLTRGGEWMPGVDELLALARRPPVRTLEIHRWVQVDGAWRREASVQQFAS